MNGFTTLMSNYAKNAISTKAGNSAAFGARSFGAAGRVAKDAYSRGATMGDSLRAGMTPLKNAWKGGDTGVRAGMIGTGAVGAMGVGAAADFANPWGLGWGD